MKYIRIEIIQSVYFLPKITCLLMSLRILSCFTDELNMPAPMEDFKMAIKKVNKSVSNDDLKKYVAWMTEFGSI